MRIAITSQNRRTVTSHAGRCRRFYLYDIDHGTIAHRQLLEIDKADTLHERAPEIPDALASLDVMISAGMCDGLVRRLARHGIEGVVTAATHPDEAIQHFLTT